jgi:uncharacterized protein (DUF488 family)
VIYTVGHSSHSAEEFLALLEAHRIQQVADVRSLPRSRRYPQFTREALDEFLAAHEVAYRHFPALGGMRTPRADSTNTAWQHQGFRGYADYMQLKTFDDGLDALLRFAREGRTAVMCAEAMWWECHRQLLSDALIVRDVPVQHILTAAIAKPHELSGFARVDGRKVIYPGLL